MLSGSLAECHIENGHIIVSSLHRVFELFLAFNVDLIIN